jgi:hypothetical protein
MRLFRHSGPAREATVPEQWLGLRFNSTIPPPAATYTAALSDPGRCR